MKLYKKIIIPHLSIIQEKLIKVFVPKLKPNLNDAFVVDRGELEQTVPELFEFFKSHCLDYDISRIFQTAPKGSLAIHVDGNKEWPKVLALNIPIIGCSNTGMCWWDKVQPTIMTNTNEYGSNIQLFDSDNKQVIDQLELVEPYLVRINVPHSVINPTDVSRIIFTARFRLEPIELFESLE